MAITTAKLKFKSGSSWISLLDIVYPVGSVYTSSANTSPASLFGGTWVQIKNKFIYYSENGTALSTGGSNTAQVVKHTHSFTGTAATIKPTASYTPAGSVNFSHMHIYNSASEMPVLYKGTFQTILANTTSGAGTRLTGLKNSGTYSVSHSVAHTGAAISDGNNLDSTLTSRSISGTAATITSSAAYTPRGTNATTGTLETTNNANMPAYQVFYAWYRTT